MSRGPAADKEEMTKPDTANEVRALRAQLGLTQEEFSRELGVSFTTVNRWENGRGKPSRLAQRQLREITRRLDSLAADGARHKAR